MIEVFPCSVIFWVSSGNSSLMFWDNLSGTILRVQDSWTPRIEPIGCLRMGPAGCPEMFGEKLLLLAVK